MHAQQLFAVPAQRNSQEHEEDNQAKRHEHEGKRFALSEQTRCCRILPAGEHTVEYDAKGTPDNAQTFQTNVGCKAVVVV